MSTKAKLVKAVTALNKDSILREELLDKVETFNVNRADALKALKSVDPSCYEKRNPICYNASKLIKSLNGELRPTVGRGAPAEATANYIVQAPSPAPLPPTVKLESVHTAEVKFVNNIIDATLDPALESFHPTRSYKKVLQRLNPNFPLNLFIFGETGVGKSTSVLHAAKVEGRAVVRANLSKFADIDDLFGGLRIVDGTTYFDKGPALVAMELGAILLLDECDSADPQLLTDLHPVLERKGYLIKKTKQMVYPTPGFCVVATANTRGRGDLTGKYIGTTALNTAFLDRFATGIEYLAPNRGELERIITTSLKSDVPESIVAGICEWYDQIDKAVNNGAIADRPSPRKVLDIIELMLSDGIEDVTDPRTKDIIVEGTNLLDTHISQALAELWDSMLLTKAANKSFE